MGQLFIDEYERAAYLARRTDEAKENARKAKANLQAKRLRLVEPTDAPQSLESPANGIVVEMPRREIPDSEVFERDSYGIMRRKPSLNTAMRRILEGE